MRGDSRTEYLAFYRALKPFQASSFLKSVFDILNVTQRSRRRSHVFPGLLFINRY